MGCGRDRVEGDLISGVAFLRGYWHVTPSAPICAQPWADDAGAGDAAATVRAGARAARLKQAPRPQALDLHDHALKQPSFVALVAAERLADTVMMAVR